MDNGAGSYRRFLNGDDTAMAEIIREYKDGLMLYLNGIVQNIYVAEDLTEETFVKLFVKRPHFFGRSTFKTWLYAVGRNLALDYIRKSAKLPTLSLEEVAFSASEEEDIQRNYLRTEQRLQVHKALKKLKPEYRQVLYLVYFEEFQNAQVATILKKSRKQIENLLYRAKQALRTELEKEGFVYEIL